MKFHFLLLLCACLLAVMPTGRAYTFSLMTPGTVAAAMEGEGETVNPDEGEGEMEPEEGEGEAPPPPGSLTGVQLLAPLGDVMTPNPTARLLFAAHALVEGGELDPAQVTVLFELDDLPVQAAWYEGLVHYLLADVDVDATTPHTVRVIARDRVTREEVHSDEHEFLVRAGTDTDRNGFADNPFAELPNAADFWTAVTGDPVCPRAVGMLAVEPGIGASVLVMPNPLLPEQFIKVAVSDALLPALARGVLIVAVACDQERLFAPYDTSGLAAAPPGVLAENGLYIEVSLIVSDDDGLSYREATPLELETHPVRISLSQLQGRPGIRNQFYAYPTSVESDPALGIRIVPRTGQWSAEGIRDLGLGADNATHTIEARRLSVFAPFELPHPAELQITPPPEQPYNFGPVPVNRVRTAAFTLANTGGEPLTCRVTLEDPAGAFNIQGARDAALEPGAQQVLKVQFIPGETRAYEARLVFTGDPAGTKTLLLRGRGVAQGKNIRPLGCGPGGNDTQGHWLSDALLVLGALLLISLRRMNCRRSAVRHTQGDVS